MHALRDAALNAYFAASYPRRRYERRVRTAMGTMPLCVLFYHRVAEAHLNPWTIRFREFQRQIDWLRGHADLVSLEELQRRVANGVNKQLAVHITFDDGYADNCEQAIPYLIEHKIPCTYFVALEFIQSGRPFPHDLTAGQPLRPNTWYQLRSLSANGIDIGAHTRTHCDLAKVTDSVTLHDEIVVSRDELSQQVGCPVPYFAFPYGQPAQLTPQAMAVAQSAGFRGICSAYGAYNWPGLNAFHIRRIHGDPEFSRFRNWMSLDPRKLHADPLRNEDP